MCILLYNVLMSPNQHPQGENRQSGRWLYDFLMEGIEPDLLLEETVLNARYKDESPIDHDARMERYEKAFAEFDRVLGMVSSAMVREANAEKYERRKKLGLRERAEQASESLSAEQSLDTFDA
jgi:hypothetical protein